MKTREEIADRLDALSKELRQQPPALDFSADDLTIHEAVALCREHRIRELKLTIRISGDDDPHEVAWHASDRNYKTHTGNTRRDAIRAAVPDLGPRIQLEQTIAELAAAGDTSADLSRSRNRNRPSNRRPSLENPMNEFDPQAVDPPPSNPFALLQAATRQGVDADQLGKLVDLHERWVAREASAAYATAMQLCQAEMPAVLRTKKGENNKYAPLEEVHEVIKPVYLRHGFSLSFSELTPSKEGLCHLCCDVRHTGGHVQRHDLEGGVDTSGPKGGATKTAIQGKGSTVSYLRRYLTLLIFNVTVMDEDRDGAAQVNVVTSEEIGVLNGLMDECAASGNPVNVDRFLKWLGVEHMEDLPLRHFSKAVAELNRKRRQPPKVGP